MKSTLPKSNLPKRNLVSFALIAGVFVALVGMLTLTQLLTANTNGVLPELAAASTKASEAKQDSNQETAETPSEESVVDAKQEAAAKKEYLASVEELRAVIKELGLHQLAYLHADSETSFDEKEKWEEAAERSKEIYSRVQKNAFTYFLAIEDPLPNQILTAEEEDLVVAVRNLNRGLFADGDIERCYKVSEKLLNFLPGDIEAQTDMARVSVLNNNFGFAKDFARTNRGRVAKFSIKEQVMFENVEELEANYDRELKLREKDKTANLPIVEMKILGKEEPIVFELFEDEAPETVANFISLIDAGFYEGIIFHRVIDAYMSHAGLISMSKREPTGYTIFDECKRPDRRHHFRGTLATWTDIAAPNSCGGEFSIMNVPAPHLTEVNHTVFGRVISGMEIVDEFQPTRTLDEKEQKEEGIEGVTPETIESMKVVRRRDHEYEPNRVQQ